MLIISVSVHEESPEPGEPHDPGEEPEDLLLVFDMEKQHPDDEVHTLTVPCHSK